MIDIENIVYSRVATAVREAFLEDYPQLTCASEYVEAPSGFPHVSVTELDNSTYMRTMTDALKEHHARVTYEINVYTNNGGSRKALAKKIAEVVDDTMFSMKFTRTGKLVVPNMDRTIFRIAMRYTAIVAAGVSKGEDDDEVITYQMYRS